MYKITCFNHTQSLVKIVVYKQFIFLWIPIKTEYVLRGYKDIEKAVIENLQEQYNVALCMIEFNKWRRAKC
jgi:hypothetical protein